MKIILLILAIIIGCLAIYSIIDIIKIRKKILKNIEENGKK
jgi:hypothetical protein